MAIWFDPTRLPDQPVFAWRKGAWKQAAIKKLRPEDVLIAWNGPLPLFAVDHFEVATEAFRSRLLATARSFADITFPSAPVEVGNLSVMSRPSQVPKGASTCPTPENWDAMRGSATMATFAVPAIDPWADLLCRMLEGRDSSSQADALHAPWFRRALWQTKVHDADEGTPALWRAMVEVFSKPGRLNEWRATELLQSICDRAISLDEDLKRIEKLRSSSLALLEDRGTVVEVGCLDDPLSLALQLLLLRPSPEKFCSWREDWYAIPPAAWWTGMVLAGYLQGYRSLPKQFRGSSEGQALLALKTWQLGGVRGTGRWEQKTPRVVSWSCGDDSIVLLADARAWAEHKLGTRGRWFRADLSNASIRREAESIAADACPDAMVTTLSVSNASVSLGGDGVVKLSAKQRRLDVEGTIELIVGRNAAIRSKLDVPVFKTWLATAAIELRLRRPPLPPADLGDASPHGEQDAALPTGHLSSTQRPRRQPNLRGEHQQSSELLGTGASQSRPAGLRIIEDFISPAEESELLAVIESQPWDTSMKRRVQHFGWRYDYKSRRVNPDNFLGPLPAWAQALAERLIAAGVVPEPPDQVIVNNYEGSQGITKHIDCPECFRGPVVTISLLETWDMVFSRKTKEGTQRFAQPLPRRSATVLSGQARDKWLHEIPVRKTEHGIPRVRRVSITFRKVSD